MCRPFGTRVINLFYPALTHRATGCAVPTGLVSDPGLLRTTESLKRKAVVGLPPDFLSRPVALMIRMRLSLRRAAHVVMASSAK
jgi:hypothetical protein